MARCAGVVVALLCRRQLHLRSSRVGSTIRVPDGREFIVFRESWRDEEVKATTVILLVWFRLRGIPAGARIRRWLFERESILNTALYAGMPGFRVKLWMVDERTSGYAGLYEWDGETRARWYGRYISAVLRPLSVPSSVGFDVVGHGSLAHHLRPTSDGGRAGAHHLQCGDDADRTDTTPNRTASCASPAAVRTSSRRPLDEMDACAAQAVMEHRDGMGR